MCGWLGIFGARVTIEDLERAADTLATRGPDAHQHRLVDPSPATGCPWPYGIAHRRLSILDLSETGAQPMVDEARSVSLVYNGELYNSPELRDRLSSAGHRFRGTSDTEVLLRGYLEWGTEVLDHIEGIYSFALVDEGRGQVFLARDRLGIKPLYWAVHEGALLAGSAPRALLALRPELGRGLDEVAIAQFLTLLWVPHPRTPWSNIHKLAPGTALTFDGTTLDQWRHWQPPAADPDPEPLDSSVLLDAIREATDRQLLSDVPVGLLFSGGLDSSILLAFMAEKYGTGELDAYTARYDARSQRLELAPDDATFARQVTDRMDQVTLHECEIDADAERDLLELAHHFDDPVADPAAISLYRLCQATDHKVLLSGVGGEELWAGYPRHQMLSTARRAMSLPLAARRSLAASSSLLFGARPGPAYAARRNLQKLVRAVGDRRPAHYWRVMAQLTYDEVDRLLPGMADPAYDELDAQCTPLASTSLADALAFDRAQFLPNLNLSYVDKASMAASVEVRVPLLDERVVDPTFAALADSFIRDGITKAPLRDAARGVVLDAVIDRPKSGFGGPARGWFQGPPGTRLAERIEAVADAGLVTKDASLAIHRAAASGRRDAALAAWALVCLHAWHETHQVHGSP